MGVVSVEGDEYSFNLVRSEVQDDATLVDFGGRLYLPERRMSEC